MSATVVQAVEFALLRQYQGLQIAQFGIAVMKHYNTVGFAQQLPVFVVGVIELIVFALSVFKVIEQVVGRVVAVVDGVIFSALTDKAA